MQTTTIYCADIRYLFDQQKEEVFIGVIPEWFNPEHDCFDELPFSAYVLYWLDQNELGKFSAGFQTDDWQLLNVKDQFQIEE